MIPKDIKSKFMPEIIKLFQGGASILKISKKFGVSPPTIAAWLDQQKINRPVKIKYRYLDKKDLENLYYQSKSLAEIAANFLVCIATVKKALTYFHTAERPPLPSVEMVQARAKAEAQAMAEDLRNGLTLIKVGKKHGCTAPTVKKRIEKFGIVLPARFVLRKAAGKILLEELISEQKMSIKNIAAQLHCSSDTVQSAIKFHKIPKRLVAARHKNRLKELAVGQMIVIATAAKYPITNLHNISKGLGIKVSVRRRKEVGTYEVTRVE